MILRLVGDVHGTHRYYRKLVTMDAVDYTVQLGDYGFEYDSLAGLDPKKHRFFGGNHDNYDVIRESPHNLGDFGLLPEFAEPVFFVRGAWSIDRKYRTPGRDWWPEEELSEAEAEAAFAAYCAAKPEVLLSHEGPFKVLPLIGLNPAFARSMGFASSHIPTRTNKLLDRMLAAHRPRLHVFGHLHRNFDHVVDGVRTVCVTADPNLRGRRRFFDVHVTPAGGRA